MYRDPRSLNAAVAADLRAVHHQPDVLVLDVPTTLLQAVGQRLLTDPGTLQCVRDGVFHHTGVPLPVMSTSSQTRLRSGVPGARWPNPPLLVEPAVRRRPCKVPAT
jgi:hypothetical protein